MQQQKAIRSYFYYVSSWVYLKLASSQASNIVSMMDCKPKTEPNGHIRCHFLFDAVLQKERNGYPHCIILGLNCRCSCLRYVYLAPLNIDDLIYQLEIFA